MHVPAAPYDARHLFSLISQLTDKKTASHLRLLWSLPMLPWAKTIALQAQKHFSQCAFFLAKRCFCRGDGWVSV